MLTWCTFSDYHLFVEYKTAYMTGGMFRYVNSNGKFDTGTYLGSYPGIFMVCTAWPNHNNTDVAVNRVNCSRLSKNQVLHTNYFSDYYWQEGYVGVHAGANWRYSRERGIFTEWSSDVDSYFGSCSRISKNQVLLTI